MKRLGVLFPLWIASASLGSSDPLELPTDGAVAEAPETNPLDGPANPEQAQRDKLLQELIAQLGDDNYKVRTAATEALWKLGDKAIGALREAAASDDPETVHRAVDLIRKIELHITPATDPRVIDLVERYVKAPPHQRLELFNQLRQARAWHQLLKLYSPEDDVDGHFAAVLSGVPIVAARELLQAGDPQGAKEFLEMAPADARNLLALADFHRVNGTWEQELEKAKRSDAPGAAAWLYALHRAVGNFKEAAEAALAAGDSAGAAIMDMCSGDPLPWLNLRGPGQRTNSNYSDLAVARWNGKKLDDQNFAPLIRMLDSRQRPTRGVASASLILLGNLEPVEKAAILTDPYTAFVHFQSLERNDEALAALGIDPAEPNFSEWFGNRIQEIIDDPDLSSEAHDVAELASFMEGRGMHAELAAALEAPLTELVNESRDGFQILLATMVYTHIPQFARNWAFKRTTGVPTPALRVAIAWAEDDVEKWEEIVRAIFEERPEVMKLWSWLEELDPTATREERLRGLLALTDVGFDPENRREIWLNLAWRTIEEAPDKARPHLDRMIQLADFRSDAQNTLRALDLIPAEEHDKLLPFTTLYPILTAGGRWAEAAELVQAQGAGDDIELTPSGHALIAGCLRNAGMIEEAEKRDRLVEMLALGDPETAATISNSYAEAGDFDRAKIWTARSIHWLPAELMNSRRLDDYAKNLLHDGDWEAAAAVAEVAASTAQIFAASGQIAVQGLQGALPLMRARLTADLARALSLLETDRERAIALLEICHQQQPCDGLLADDFFPLVRKAGLIEEHDAWFAKSWELITKEIERTPNSHNTLNTAGWLASRAARRLPEAAELLNRALALNPAQPAYLDTYAEIQFAMGNREAAIEWSRQAVNFEPADPMIRRQHHRFSVEPLP
jgi:tetratricopeptide (TPR) repeat protein